MYVCMREYDPQIGNDTSWQGDLLIDIFQVTVIAEPPVCMYACMYSMYENEYVYYTM